MVDDLVSNPAAFQNFLKNIALIFLFKALKCYPTGFMIKNLNI